MKAASRKEISLTLSERTSRLSHVESMTGFPSAANLMAACNQNRENFGKIIVFFAIQIKYNAPKQTATLTAMKVQCISNDNLTKFEIPHVGSGLDLQLNFK